MKLPARIDLLLKVRLSGLKTPRAAAAAVVTGGLVRQRRRLDPVSPTQLDDYSRAAPEWPRLGAWNVFPEVRTVATTKRLVRRGYPPTARVELNRSSGRPPGRIFRRVGRWLRLDLSRRRPFFRIFHRSSTPVVPVGDRVGWPVLQVHHRRRTAFTTWARARAHRGYRTGLYGFQPHKQNDPVRLRRDWAFLVGGSPLEGLRNRSLLSGLFRRHRQRRRDHRRLRRWTRYQRFHFGRRRRRLGWRLKRFYLFRRRRLRGYRTRKVTFKNYLRGLTRAGFKKFNLARPARIERSLKLVAGGTSYLEGLGDWAAARMDGRVTTPLEYNLYRPATGFYKLDKKRRPGARRWKLGQHKEGIFFRSVRDIRWAWFRQTFWGGLVETARAAGVSTRVPTRAGPAAALYWSVEKWGRSRWPVRPVGRAGRVFVRANKSGLAVEHDANQWGRSGAAATGALLSLAAEFDLTPMTTPRRRRGSSPHGGVYTRRQPRPGGYLIRWVYARSWRLFSLLWWPYAAAAAIWLGVAFVPVWLCAQILAFARAIVAGGAELSRQFWRPLRRWGWRRFRLGRFARTVGWVYSAWLVVYSSEDDQSELDLIFPSDDDYLVGVDEDVNVTNDHDQDFDQLGVGTHRQNRLSDDPVWEEGWYHDIDSWWDDWTEQIEDLLLDELPHRAGLLFRPWADFAVRLPVWGVLEGLSLMGLTIKLEYQRVWHDLLARPGGRFGKVVLVSGVWLGRMLTWITVFYFLFHQLDYATLRVELVCTWGLTWREEYYLGWICFCLVSSVYLVGPASWKNFLFQELGWNYLAGLFVGITEVAEPDDYYPARPSEPVGRAFHQVAAGFYTRDEYQNFPDEYDHETPWAGMNFGYEDIGVVAVREYGFEDTPYEPVGDIDNLGFLFPLHLEVRTDLEPWWARPDVMSRERSTRDGHGFRTNRYVLHYDVGNKLPYWIPGPIHGVYPRERNVRVQPEDYASD